MSLEDYGARLLEFKVVPSCVKGRALDAYWTVEKTDASLAFTPRFNLCVGETSNGPWYPVLEAPTFDTSVIGIGHKLLSHRPGRFIRLQVIDPDGDVVFLTDPMDPTHGMTRRDYLEYREQIRLENLALTKHTGVPGYLFKKIITECPCDCGDEILEGAFDSHCPDCFGTGKVGGYHPPLMMLADWSDAPKGLGNQKEAKQGITEVERKKIKALPFPKMAYKDVWADGAGDLMYEVVSSVPVLYKIYPTAQLVVLSLLPKTDPAYKLQVPIA